MQFKTKCAEHDYLEFEARTIEQIEEIITNVENLAYCLGECARQWCDLIENDGMDAPETVELSIEADGYVTDIEEALTEVDHLIEDINRAYSDSVCA